MKSKVFSKEYYPLIRALCDLEAIQFPFVDDKSRDSWAESLFQSFVDFELEEPGFNYCLVESISNMGLVLHSVKISTSHYKGDRELRAAFPMTPRQGRRMIFSEISS